MLDNEKYIIPIHKNFFPIFETKFDKRIINIMKYKDFSQKSNILLIDNIEDIKDIILMNF